MSKDAWIAEEEAIIARFDDGDMDVLAAADALRDLGVPDDKIADLLGEHWLYVEIAWGLRP